MDFPYFLFYFIYLFVILNLFINLFILADFFLGGEANYFTIL